MRTEIRTLLRGISTIAILLTLLVATSVGTFAHDKHRKRARHDNGRHLGWTVGRHRGWSHSRHRGVNQDGTFPDVLRGRRRSNRGLIISERARERNDGGTVMHGHGRGRGNSGKH